MKAAQIKQYGHIDSVEVVDVETPTPPSGQVLVEVHASSLNPVDTMMREGYTRQMMDPPMPVTLGGDVAGTVAVVGEGVTEFQVGEKVYGQAFVLRGGSGAFAEYAITPAIRIAAMPKNLDFKQAASLPLVGVSALQGLKEHINLQSGQKLFIHGASGGIGTIAVQIAKSMGAYIAASVHGEESAEHVKELGANEVIDTSKQDFTTMLRDYDAVFDCVGGDDFTKSLVILKPGGIAVSMKAHADDAEAKAKQVTTMTEGADPTTSRLDSLRELVEEGAVKPQVTRVYPLNQIREAFAERESGGFIGKIVVAVKED